MALLKNMKIKTKLGLGFGLLLFITLIITIIGMNNIRIVDTDYSYTLDFTLVRYSLVRNLEVDMVNLRRIVATSAFQTGNMAAISGLEQSLNTTRDAMLVTLDQFMNSFQEDELEGGGSLQMVQAINLNNLISSYLSQVAYPGLAASRAGDTDQIYRLLPLAEQISGSINAQFDALLSDMRAHIAGSVEQNNQAIRATMFMLGVLGGGSLLLGIVIAAFITRGITRPVRAVVAALRDVANGNLNANLKVNNADEIGMLTQSTQNLADTLQTLMQDMDNMSTAHDRGDIDVFIPEEKFAGAYSEVAKKINYMVNSHLKIQNRLVEVFAEIVNANFEAQLEQLPGKKALLNDTVNTIRDTIRRQHRIYNANPIPGSLWDAGSNATDCNDAMLKLLGMSSREEYTNRDIFLNYSPEYQPDGTPSTEKIREIYQRALEIDSFRFSWMHLTSEKELVPCEVTLVRIDLKDTFLFALYAQDLRPLREADTRIREAEEMSEIFLGASPFVMNIWDEDINLVSTSQQSVKMFGLSSQKQYIEQFFELSPEYQPCGTPSGEKAYNYVCQAFREGYVQFEWMHQTLDYEPVPSEITIVRFKRQGRFFAAAFTVDLRPSKAAMEKERELELSRRIRLMFDATPLMIEYWDKNYNAIECNKTTLDYYEYSDKEEYKKNKTKSAPGFLTDSTSVWNNHLEEVFETGFGRFEFMEQKTKNDIAFMEVDAIRMKYNDELVVVTYSNDVTQLKKNERAIAQAQESLLYRDTLLYTVNQAAKILLTATTSRDDFETALMQSMEMIGLSLKADRVQLWHADLYSDGIYITLTHQWISELGQQNLITRANQKIVFGRLKEWENLLLRGECFNGPVANLPPQERQFMESHGEIKSIVIIPVFLYEKLWGFCTIADCLNERTLPDEDINILRSASLMIASAYHRTALAAAERDAQAALKYREKLLCTMNQAAEVLLTANEDDSMKALTAGMTLVGHCVDADRVQIWRSEIIDDNMYFVMRYEWLSEIGKQKPEVPLGLKLPCSAVPDWLEMFLRGESINAPISKLPPAESAFLSQHEMISIVMLPLFLNKEFVGFFSIDDCQRERIFTEDEMQIIASAGLMFASVFNRNLQAEKIAEANKQREYALQQALAANRAKSDFLSTMSHEMRTPMNAIIGMTTIAKNEGDNERKSAALKKVEEAANHLLVIISDVLDMSKIEANKLELQYAEFNLEEALRKAISLLDFRLEAKQHHFNINMDKDMPSFFVGDEQRLMQIVMNLMSNAITYTPNEGKISLDVSLENDAGGICSLRFVVADNGIGIPAEQQERLFQMFEQGDNSASRRHGGTGLGLAISKRLIDLMDGTIAVESEVGKGSRFIFTIKLECKEKSEQTLSSTEAAAPSDNTKFPGKRLLLVEDIEINRDILIALLEDTELLIDVAENGREAVDMVTANPDSYDLVFMDMQMPEMDGLEATRRIRSLSENSAEKLPIIAMTANVFADDVEKCLAAGMNGHIGKPLDMRIVFENLSRYL